MEDFNSKQEQREFDLIQEGDAYPSGYLRSIIGFVKLRLFGRDMTLPLSKDYEAHRIEHPHEFSPEELGLSEIAEASSKKIKCTPKRIAAEYKLLVKAYQLVVKKNLAAGWVYGFSGNFKISIGYAKSGSCSDWQHDIRNALCRIPNIHCWQICRVRSIWHKAVVIYPKNTTHWKLGGTVLDPWWSGFPMAYAPLHWDVKSSLSVKYDCCK